MGDEAPRVNLDGSQVSNKNFDEKMIETVNSEQLDSTKGKPDAPEQDPRPMMDHIREVNEDNDNSNPKTASLQRPDKQSDKHRSESGAEAEAELPATGVLADSAPLNEPTFMKEAREQKKQMFGSKKTDPNELVNKLFSGSRAASLERESVANTTIGMNSIDEVLKANRQRLLERDDQRSTESGGEQE